MFNYKNLTLLIAKPSPTGECPPFVNEKMEVLGISSAYSQGVSYFGIWMEENGATHEDMFLNKRKKIEGHYNNFLQEKTDSAYLREMKRVCFAADNGDYVSEMEKQKYLAYRGYDIAVNKVAVIEEDAYDEDSIIYLPQNENASDEERIQIMKRCLDQDYNAAVTKLVMTYVESPEEYKKVYTKVASLLHEEEKINLVLYLPRNKKIIEPKEISLKEFTIEMFITINPLENYLVIQK